jgi:hypothetical protein
MLSNVSIAAFASGAPAGHLPSRMALVMDEVDGMSSGDRGGMQALIRLLNTAKMPVRGPADSSCPPRINHPTFAFQTRFHPAPLLRRPRRLQALIRLLNTATMPVGGSASSPSPPPTHPPTCFLNRIASFACCFPLLLSLSFPLHAPPSPLRPPCRYPSSTTSRQHSPRPPSTASATHPPLPAQVICICNDRGSQKVKSLAGHCLDLRFRRPSPREVRRHPKPAEPEEGAPPPKARVVAAAAASRQ